MGNEALMAVHGLILVRWRPNSCSLVSDNMCHSTRVFYFSFELSLVCPPMNNNNDDTIVTKLTVTHVLTQKALSLFP